MLPSTGLRYLEYNWNIKDDILAADFILQLGAIVLSANKKTKPDNW